MNGFVRYVSRISLLIFFLFMFMPSCKDDINSSIPYVFVSFQVNLIQYNDLTVPSNSVAFPAGFGGVIVTNTGLGYAACDAACPYEIDTQCKVVPEGGIATCPCCGSQYLLLEGGSLLSGTGPSTEPLKPYQVSTAGGGSTLIVTN